MDLAEMGAFLSARFSSEMFRMETLQRYLSSSDGDDLAAYLRGDPKPVVESEWLAMLRADAAASPPRRWRKIHVVHGALSEYERYEFEWGFQDTVAAGEDVRILEVADEIRLDELVGDFYVVDYTYVVRVHYDEADRFAGGEVVQGREAHALVAVRDLAWQQAIPFGRWWEANPQHHRSTRAA